VGEKDYEVSTQAFTEDGISINSEFLNGLSTKEAKKTMIQQLEKIQ
jgi:leucyl-tRNA synthetase